MIDDLRVEHDRLSAWLNDNTDKMGTPEHRKALLAHRLLTDLIALDGGTKEQRAYVWQQLG